METYLPQESFLHERKKCISFLYYVFEEVGTEIHGLQHGVQQKDGSVMQQLEVDDIGDR